MTTLELLKAAMQYNDSVELSQKNKSKKFTLYMYKFTDYLLNNEHFMGRCVMWSEGEIEKYATISTLYGRPEEELFQTVADLYDGTIENFLEKVE